MIPVGIHKAKIVDWGVVFQERNSEHKIFIQFECEDFNNETIKWNLSMDAGPQISKAGKPYTLLDITISKLANLDYKYKEDIEGVAQSDAFNTTKDFYIEVQSFTADDGKIISYVKEASNSPVMKKTASPKMGQDETLKVLQAVKAKRKPVGQQTVAKAADTSDIPF